MTGNPRVGFVGIGNMGWPMAGHLVRGGVPVTVFDARPEVSQRFAGQIGGEVAPDLAALGRASDVLVTMLPDGKVVRRFLLEEEGGAVVDALANGSIVLDMSSSEPVGTRELGKDLAARGITLVDAPVSGGVVGAEKATLAIMVGSDDPAAVDRVWPLIEKMGGKLFRTGRLGSGHALKALNNFCSAAGFAAAAEALIVGRKFGLDPALMTDVINASSGRNNSTETKLKPHVLTRAFATGFSIGLMAKDVKTAADMAEALGVDAPLTREMRRMWAEARDDVGATSDHSAAIVHWENVNKLRVTEDG